MSHGVPSTGTDGQLYSVRIAADLANFGRVRVRSGLALDPSYLSSADVDVTGFGITTPVATSIGLVGGATRELVLRIPAGPNRVVSVRGYGSGPSGIPQNTVIRGVLSVPDDGAIRVNWATTPAAGIILALRAIGSPLERQIDRYELQRLVNKTVFGTPDGSVLSQYAVHPALFDVSAAADTLIQANKVPSSLLAAGVAPATLTGQVQGLLKGERALVTLDDPSSSPVLTNASGVFQITEITPGGPWTVFATSSFYSSSQVKTSPVATGSSAAVVLALGGNFLKDTLKPDPCGASETSRRWLQLPIRLLVIEPSAVAASAMQFLRAHRADLDAAVMAIEQNFPGSVAFDVRTRSDDAADLTSEIRRSDIYVHWSQSLKNSCGKADTIGCAILTATLLPCQASSTLRSQSLQARVIVATHLSDGKKMPQRRHRATILHEIMHALGLGHSAEVTDIMYPSGSAFGPNLTLAEGDVNTLRFLYSLPPSLTRDHGTHDLVPETQNSGIFSYDVPAAANPELVVAD